jgi:uncharacterized phage protein (TIGR02218 family)
MTELYKFSRGTAEWYKTSSSAAVSYGGDTYSPAVIGRGNIESKNELSKSKLEVSLDINDDLAQEVLLSTVDTTLAITLFRQDDTGTSVLWKGKMLAAAPSGTALKVTFDNVFVGLKRAGLIARYQKTCRHVLYGPWCGVNKDDFATAGTASAVDGVDITVAAAASEDDGYFAGGMLRTADDIYGYIVAHSGSMITLQRAIGSLAVDDTVTLYPGCDKVRGTCINKFDNVINFGGFRIPAKNPMGGSSII